MKLNKFEIKAHEFRHPIEIQRYDDGKNEDNIPIKAWNLLFATRAKILNGRGSELQGELGNSSVIYKTFYIRTRRATPVTELDRVVYNNNNYEIEYANDIEEAGVITEIKAKLVK